MLHIFILFFILFTIGINFGVLYLFPLVGIIANNITIIIYLLLAAYDFCDLYAQDVFALSATFILVNLISLYLHFSGIYVNTLIAYIFLLFISLLFCLKIFHQKRLFNFTNMKHIYIIFPLGILLGFAVYYFIAFAQFFPLHLTHIQAISLILLMGIAEGIFFSRTYPKCSNRND